MERIKAYINEKDVTTDWMESVFDSPSVLMHKNNMCGYIGDTIVFATWEDNAIDWQIFRVGDWAEAYLILEQRLKAWKDEEQNVYSEFFYGGLNITQHFYFKEV